MQTRAWEWEDEAFGRGMRQQTFIRTEPNEGSGVSGQGDEVEAVVEMDAEVDETLLARELAALEDPEDKPPTLEDDEYSESGRNPSQLTNPLQVSEDEEEEAGTVTDYMLRRVRTDWGFFSGW